MGRYALVFEDEVVDDQEGETREMGFVYTTSVAWAWRVGSDVLGAFEEGCDGEEDEFTFLDGDVPHLSNLGTGFLGDEVVLGIGIDDVEQVVVRVSVNELLSCLTLCPGVEVEDSER